MIDSRTEEVGFWPLIHYFRALRSRKDSGLGGSGKTESPLRRSTPDPRKSGGNVFDILPEVSSTEGVEVFLEVEPLLGFKIKGSGGIIKPGGLSQLR